jgi:hypothetical protein
MEKFEIIPQSSNSFQNSVDESMPGSRENSQQNKSKFSSFVTNEPIARTQSSDLKTQQ